MTKSQQLLERLKMKRGYKKFIENNKDAFLYAMFCILSSEEKEGDKIQFDFYTPSTKKIAYSEYPFDGIQVQNQESQVTSGKLELDNIEVDVEDLWGVVKKLQLEKQDTATIAKIMGILRGNAWELTCTTSTIDIMRIKINATNGECIDYKKENLANFIQIKKK